MSNPSGSSSARLQGFSTRAAPGARGRATRWRTLLPLLHRRRPGVAPVRREEPVAMPDQWCAHEAAVSFALLALRGSQADAAEALRNAERASRAARAEVAALVQDMLASGGSWSEIAAALGADEVETKRRYGGGSVS